MSGIWTHQLWRMLKNPQMLYMCREPRGQRAQMPYHQLHNPSRKSMCTPTGKVYKLQRPPFRHLQQLPKKESSYRGSEKKETRRQKAKRKQKAHASSNTKKAGSYHHPKKRQGTRNGAGQS